MAVAGNFDEILTTTTATSDCVENLDELKLSESQQSPAADDAGVTMETKWTLGQEDTRKLDVKDVVKPKVRQESEKGKWHDKNSPKIC